MRSHMYLVYNPKHPVYDVVTGLLVIRRAVRRVPPEVALAKPGSDIILLVISQ